MTTQRKLAIWNLILERVQAGQLSIHRDSDLKWINYNPKADDRYQESYGLCEILVDLHDDHLINSDERRKTDNEIQEVWEAQAIGAYFWTRDAKGQQQRIKAVQSRIEFIKTTIKD